MTLRKLALAILLFLACGVTSATAAPCASFAVATLGTVTYVGNTIQRTTTITVNCPAGTAYTIGFRVGLYDVSVTDRRMRRTGGTPIPPLGTYNLNFQLFRDPAYTANWGITPGIDTVSGTGTGSSQSITLYFKVPGGQTTPTGTYQDTIVVDLLDANSALMNNATFQLAADVNAYCTISAANLLFGNYTGAMIDATSAITAGCSSLTAYNIGLNAGTGSGATVAARKMTGPGGAVLNYRLSRDALQLLNWGNTVLIDTVLGTGTGSPQSYTVYGQLPAGQSAGGGTYTDTITATITY